MDMIRHAQNERSDFLHCLPSFHDRNTEFGEKVYQQFGLVEMEVTDEVFYSRYSEYLIKRKIAYTPLKAVMCHIYNREKRPNMPVFGIRKAERRVVLRTGAYGIVTNINGKVMIIQNKLGKILPGGGLMPGESYEEALHREFWKKQDTKSSSNANSKPCHGISTLPLNGLCRYLIRAFFMEVELVKRVNTDIEEGHEILLFVDGESATDMRPMPKCGPFINIYCPKYPPIIKTNASASEDRIYPLRLTSTLHRLKPNKIKLFCSQATS